MSVQSRLGLALIVSVLSCNLWASAQILELQDGRKVILNDDFTWKYIATKTLEVNKGDGGNSIATPLTVKEVIPVVPKVDIKAVKILLGEDKSLLQLNKSGVDILLRSPRYDNGKLIIPVGLTNQSSESVIKITLEYTLLDENHQILDSGTAPVWTSIKRVADTYFRPRTQQEGRDIILTAPSKDSYLFKAEIIDIETR